MKRASQYTALCIFCVSAPLLFNVQIKDFQIRSKSQEIDDAVKKANLIGKQKNVAIKSLENIFKGKKVEFLNYQGRNEASLVFDNVAHSFDTTIGPSGWEIGLHLYFDRKNNRLIKYELTSGSTSRL